MPSLSPHRSPSDERSLPPVIPGRLTFLLLLSSLLHAVPARAEATGSTNHARLESIMGPFPGSDRRTPISHRVLSSTNGPGWVLQDIRYAADPGDEVPAWLLLPAAATNNSTRAFPAVLALHQTHAAGRNVVVGLGNSPDDEYGLELVRRGYVVLAPSYPHLAEYAPDLSKWNSGTMKAIWDNSRGLDLLASLPCVATHRGFGVIGHSLGGHNGLFTAAFDPRLTAVVTSCGFDSFRDYQEGREDLWQRGRGWCQDRYMPRLAEYRGKLERLPFDFADVLSAITPRPVFVNAPRGDSNFRWRSVDRVVEEVVQRDAGRARITVEHPDVPHRFPPEQRRQAYDLFNRVLKP
jgi:hypothetical protein